jgi:hypothetical protein
VVDKFRAELKALGWIEDSNLRIEFRWSDNDTAKAQAFAKELVAMQPDLLIGHTDSSVAAIVSLRGLHFCEGSQLFVLVGNGEQRFPGDRVSCEPRLCSSLIRAFPYCAGSSWVGVIIPTHHALMPTRDDVLARAADYVFAALPDLCTVSKEFIALSNQ